MDAYTLFAHGKMLTLDGVHTATHWLRKWCRWFRIDWKRSRELADAMEYQRIVRGA